MILQHPKDLLAIFPQSKWDKIDTLIPLFNQVERTRLRPVLGSNLLAYLNTFAQNYTHEGVQAALIAQQTEASTTVPSDSSEGTTLSLISSVQFYIAYITFANNPRIFSSSFNRGGGVNRAFSDSYEGFDEKDFQALAKELFMRSQDTIEDILLQLEQDAQDQRIFTDLWRAGAPQYYYYHSNLLFPTATALNPYYDIKERRETFQSLVPTIASCQRRYLIPNLGQKLYQAFLQEANALHPNEGGIPPIDTIDSVDYAETIAPIIRSALPDLLHSLAYYLRADLTTAPKTQQEQNQYLLRAEQHRNLAVRIILEEADNMQDYIVGTPLDFVYKEIHGITLTDHLAQANATSSEANPCHCKCRSHNLPSDSFMLDLTS